MLFSWRGSITMEVSTMLGCIEIKLQCQDLKF